MYCSNCGFRLPKTHHNYCPQCGAELSAQARGKNAQAYSHALSHPPVLSVGRRIAVVLYVLTYLALFAISTVAGLTIYQSFTTPDPQKSYVTCHDGKKVSYATL